MSLPWCHLLLRNISPPHSEKCADGKYGVPYKRNIHLIFQYVSMPNFYHKSLHAEIPNYCSQCFFIMPDTLPYIITKFDVYSAGNASIYSAICSCVGLLTARRRRREKAMTSEPGCVWQIWTAMQPVRRHRACRESGTTKSRNNISRAILSPISSPHYWAFDIGS